MITIHKVMAVEAIGPRVRYFRWKNWTLTFTGRNAPKLSLPALILFVESDGPLPLLQIKNEDYFYDVIFSKQATAA